MTELQTEADLYALVTAAIAAAGTQRAFARQVGITEQFVADVVRKRRKVGQTIARHFGYRVVRRYERVTS